MVGSLGLPAVDIGQELDFATFRAVANFHQKVPAQCGKQPGFDSRMVPDAIQVLDQREESLLNQIRGIRFAPGKTNSKLVKRSVKTVNDWQQARRSAECTFVLINRLFALNHVAPVIFQMSRFLTRDLTENRISAVIEKKRR